MSANELRFSAGNYAHRVDDACYVQIGEATAYFASNRLIALVAKDVLYRVNDLDSGGITYKRLRAIATTHNKKKTRLISRFELQAMTEAALMNFASKLIDERMK